VNVAPSATTRGRVAVACSRLGGSPQIPEPVIRIAPKPRRLTVRSPPTSMVPAAAAVGCALTPYLLMLTGSQNAHRQLLMISRRRRSGGRPQTGQQCLDACHARCAGVVTMTCRTPVCTIRSGLKCRGRLGGEAVIQG